MTMAVALILVPVVAAAIALVTPSDRWRPWLMSAAAAGHTALTALALGGTPPSEADGWLVLDPLGKVFLALVSTLFCICSVYTARYLTLGHAQPNRIFCVCFLVSLAGMSLVILSQHLGLMWVGMEATTLVTAPNIYFNRTPRALEATWKYLIICSVGIALALLGSFFLAYSTLNAHLESPLLLGELVRHAGELSHPWLRAAFVLALVGYGTKMGLAPMHTWLPDAYGEAPAPASAILSGALMPCAFLAILRFFHICDAAGEGAFARQILVAIGLFSMAVGAVFMTGQHDLKRLLAYSSVEHIGILIFAIGVGGLAVFGALLHVCNNGLTKVTLFLCAGNIQRAYGSRSSDDISGALHCLPVTASAFLAGFFAITGSPPFGPFVSEFTIVSAALGAGHFVAGGLFLVFLAVAFIGMGSTVLPVVLGRPPESATARGFREDFLIVMPFLVSLGLVLLLGLYIPPPVDSLLREAAAFLEVKP
jgi:hydrogenase-4 component F